ncbi:hypothetical protein EB796_024286 [Bugula neritina]|uniref:Uncharacterized protein n=1 Tax=Bugula neritina TaxID=10212 RepID=A0A7J7IU08_BUGNE|nr:hypothetical protein EB796_024286 [Bugula neritina]
MRPFLTTTPSVRVDFGRLFIICAEKDVLVSLMSCNISLVDYASNTTTDFAICLLCWHNNPRKALQFMSCI